MKEECEQEGDACWQCSHRDQVLQCDAKAVGKILESTAENRVLRDESKLSGTISSRGRIQFVFEEFGATRLAEWQRMA